MTISSLSDLVGTNKLEPHGHYGQTDTPSHTFDYKELDGAKNAGIHPKSKLRKNSSNLWSRVAEINIQLPILSQNYFEHRDILIQTENGKYPFLPAGSAK